MKEAPQKGKVAVHCKAITKRFGQVLANDKVDFEVRYGEILALMGENGSGKTTLVNMLSGIYHPDEGAIYVDGRQVHIASPADAFALGIGMIHQHFKLVDVMSALDNIMLGADKAAGGRRAERRAAEELCSRYGMEMDLDQRVYDMAVSQKQTVEILKVLHRKARILILDEPTAALTPQETASLFEILRSMRDAGCAVVIITHKLNEVMAISDRVAVLRQGKSVASVPTVEASEKQLTELMVGREIDLKIQHPHFSAEQQLPLLEVEDLCCLRSDGAEGLKNVSFTLQSGEILGIAGVAGSGQKELSEAIVGLIPSQSGSIRFKGAELVGKTTRDIYKEGVSLAFVPEDRLGMGLVSSMGMTGNMMLKTYRGEKGLFVHRRPAAKKAAELKERLDIKTPSIETPVRMLSGGNVQKVLIGREIDSDPQVLITAYAVRGLDIHSSYTIYDLLNEQKMKGAGVLFVGEDLDVLLELADRILVLCGGRVTGIVDAAGATKEQIGLMMAGISEEAAV